MWRAATTYLKQWWSGPGYYSCTGLRRRTGELEHVARHEENGVAQARLLTSVVNWQRMAAIS